MKYFILFSILISSVVFADDFCKSPLKRQGNRCFWEPRAPFNILNGCPNFQEFDNVSGCNISGSADSCGKFLRQSCQQIRNTCVGNQLHWNDVKRQYSKNPNLMAAKDFNRLDNEYKRNEQYCRDGHKNNKPFISVSINETDQPIVDCDIIKADANEWIKSAFESGYRRAKVSNELVKHYSSDEIGYGLCENFLKKLVRNYVVPPNPTNTIVLANQVLTSEEGLIPNQVSCPTSNSSGLNGASTQGLDGVYPGGSLFGDGNISCQNIPMELIDGVENGQCSVNHNKLLEHLTSAEGFLGNLNRTFDALNQNANGKQIKQCTSEQLTGSENQNPAGIDSSGQRKLSVACPTQAADLPCLTSNEILNFLKQDSDELDQSYTQGVYDYVDNIGCGLESVTGIGDGQSSTGQDCEQFNKNYGKGNPRQAIARMIGPEVVPALVKSLEQFDLAPMTSLGKKQVPTSINIPGINRKICLTSSGKHYSESSQPNKELEEGSTNHSNFNHGIIKIIDNFVTTTSDSDDRKRIDCVNVPAEILRHAIYNDSCGGIDKIREYLSSGIDSYNNGKMAANIVIGGIASLIPGGPFVAALTACAVSSVQTYNEISNNDQFNRQAAVEEIARANNVLKANYEQLEKLYTENKQAIEAGATPNLELVKSLTTSCVGSLLTIRKYATISKISTRASKLLPAGRIQNLARIAARNPALTESLASISLKRNIEVIDLIDIAEQVVTDRMAKRIFGSQEQSNDEIFLTRLNQIKLKAKQPGANKAELSNDFLTLMSRADNKTSQDFIDQIAIRNTLEPNSLNPTTRLVSEVEVRALQETISTATENLQTRMNQQDNGMSDTQRFDRTLNTIRKIDKNLSKKPEVESVVTSAVGLMNDTSKFQQWWGDVVLDVKTKNPEGFKTKEQFETALETELVKRYQVLNGPDAKPVVFLDPNGPDRIEIDSNGSERIIKNCCNSASHLIEVTQGRPFIDINDPGPSNQEKPENHGRLTHTIQQLYLATSLGREKSNMLFDYFKSDTSGKIQDRLIDDNRSIGITKLSDPEALNHLIIEPTILNVLAP
ncbi:MAG: hypothetical protein COW01_15090 [Bdellovibrionales bacterium CG12_big_fil_rev_8_21_14_0_65_38_15]|nr:MAG: hypothetical protein COW79_09650 [Bdellovibrionales bacterium CG22_combo_CG10-13_8_21_14_all_38_13]PIQ52762.1 MAG: hypothetical protein COW01_15090 [Bdellovibrionales bacterium CG12_big_fil_rev_8_21_14_0_65_38_15]